MQMTYALDEFQLFWSQEKPEYPQLEPMPGGKWRRFLNLQSKSVGPVQFRHSIHLHNKSVHQG